MNEDYLQFVWKHQLVRDKQQMYTTTGEKVDVLHAGEQNFDSGPDFLNCRIKINNIIWAGAVEIHKKASDWQAHKHNGNRAYDNVILHVVAEKDRETLRTNGELIPTVELELHPTYLDNYQDLIYNKHWISCQKHLPSIDKFNVFFWLNTLAVERLAAKSEPMLADLEKNHYNWEETFYHFLARNFGMNTNAQPFEQLALSIPLTVISRHRNNLKQIEALLLGHAGFLNADNNDSYFQDLKQEYTHLKAKLNSSPILPHQWKFMRLRPSNFPELRLAQFAALMHKTGNLFSTFMENKPTEALKSIFDISLNEYWNEHYSFGKKSPFKVKTFGETARDNILINTVVPLQFLYGKVKGDSDLREKALEMLESLPPEDNVITRGWKKLGIEAANALHSQAMIQLKKQYCDPKQCLRCQLGMKLITNNERNM